jgi:hypothetical protein
MKINCQIIVILLMSVLYNSHIQAQTTIDSARNAALKFFKTYDSIPYVTFDARYTLFSDTLQGDFTVETTSGIYTMSGPKAKYSLGDVEYLQNDSFLVAVYHKDQMMVVSRPPVQSSGQYVPMRALLDSLLNVYAAQYDIWVKSSSPDPETDNIGYIKLVKKPHAEQAVYNKYIIEFDLLNNVITKVEFEYTQPGLDLDPDDEPNEAKRILKNTPRRQTLRIEFVNYRFDNFSDDIYSENNLVWQEDGEYKPVEQYKAYRVFNARN